MNQCTTIYNYMKQHGSVGRTGHGMKSIFEDIAVVIVGSVIVVGMTLLYWVCRLCGVRLEDDF